jgi:hypothetical protein
MIAVFTGRLVVITVPPRPDRQDPATHTLSANFIENLIIGVPLASHSPSEIQGKNRELQICQGLGKSSA